MSLSTSASTGPSLLDDARTTIVTGRQAATRLGFGHASLALLQVRQEYAILLVEAQGVSLTSSTRRIDRRGTAHERAHIARVRLHAPAGVVDLLEHLVRIADPDERVEDRPAATR